MTETMSMSRVWAIPNCDTFDVEPIHNFVWKYLHKAKVSVDPFARNKQWATYTNDINPNTSAAYHLDATDFLDTLRDQNVKADFLLFDPPYSPRQLKNAMTASGRRCSLRTARLGGSGKNGGITRCHYLLRMR